MRALPLVVAVLVSTAAADVDRDTPVVAIKTKVSKATVESTLTVDRVKAKLQLAYFAEIERCYQDRFGTSPRASGDMKLVFGVEPDGMTIGAVAASFDKKLDACVIERVKTWRFDVPKDKTDKAIATSFSFELALVPIAVGDPLASKKPRPRKAEDEAATPSAATPSAVGSVKVGGGGGGARVPSAPPQGVSARVQVATKNALDTTTLTPDTVLAKIQAAYMAGVKRCYKNALKRDPTLKGKLTIAFAVVDSGKTSSQTVTAFDTNLADCVKALVANWRFPIPTKGDAAASARFEIVLGMTPD